MKCAKPDPQKTLDYLFITTSLASPGVLFVLLSIMNWHNHFVASTNSYQSFDTEVRAWFLTSGAIMWLITFIPIAIGLVLKNEISLTFVSSYFFKNWYVLTWCFIWVFMIAIIDVYPRLEIRRTPYENPIFWILLTMLGPIRFIYEFVSLYPLQELFSISKSTLIYSMFMTFWIIPVSGLVFHHLYFSKYKYYFHVPIITCLLTFCWAYSAFFISAFD